ncbi:MAG: hypothetical protein AAFN77_14480 [Planctomycetota bacterium]
MIPKNHSEVVQYYRDRLAEQEQEARNCAGQWSGVGYVRGLLLLGSIIPAVMGFANAYELGTLFYVIAGVLFGVFVAVALYHEQLQTRLFRARLLAKMHRESIARCERRWTDINVPPVEIPGWFAPISKDLDLLGNSSVYKLLGTTRTPLGTETLKNWIIDGALDEEIQLRQDAVAELKPDFDWREQFRLRCEYLADSQSGPSRFVEWCESPCWFDGNQWVLWLTRVTASVSLITILGTLITLIPFNVAGPIIIVTCAINFFVSVFRAGSIHEVFNQVSSRSNDATRYVQLFDMVADYDAKSKKLIGLQTQFQQTGQGAQSKMQRLGWLVGLANMRRNGTLFIPYMILEFLFFWDAHMLDLLERWKDKNGAEARRWFERLAEVEALAALAKLAGDEPDWVFPTVKTDSPNEALVQGVKVGHPLLGTERVANDVEMGPPGTVLLVTGSNMSGKSTLLRSVGANIVLAQMGSVVCAESMTLPPIRIETSMRIADSLADGVSFFMAELKRLKEIVDTAKKHDADNPRRLLFLLDEILQGTNSQERQIAVSRVVRKLIDEQAIGAISTHDLDLAKTDELAKACRTVHFSEQFDEVDGKKTMTFDYVMKPGIAETTNALKLLEIVGLGE